MATPSTLFLPLILLAVTFSTAFRTVSSFEDGAFSSDSLLRIELNQLRSSISILEVRIGGRVEELKSKDDNIKQMEKNIEEKTDYIASLIIQIEALQKRSRETEKLKTKINARFSELNNQVDSLRKEIEAQKKKKDDLEVRRYTAEEKIRELYLKLESLQKISDEQRAWISEIKHNIQFAEERIVKLKLEVSLVSEEMNRIYGVWFPPWMVASIDRCRSYSITVWTDHGRPSLDWAIQKALEMKGIVQEWTDPHIKAVEKNWISKMKQQLFMVVVYLEPQLVEFQEFAHRYFQHLKPCITRFSVTTKPHFDKLRATLRPYTREIVQTYRRLIRSVMARHTQVQDMVLRLLDGHEYSRPFADKVIVWYLASAIFALPAILIVNLYTSIVSNKPQERRHKQHHARRGAKRIRPEN